MNLRLSFGILGLSAAILSACSTQSIDQEGSYSAKTGFKYGGEEYDYKPVKYDATKAAPGLVFIEGGTFHMGGGEKDLGYEQNNRERQITVASFYIDETEISNVNWKEFLYYVKKDSTPEKYTAMYPDTNVWFRELAYNDPYVHYYYQHAGFNTYPVVGIDWYQANEYAIWRTRIVNENLIKEKFQDGGDAGGDADAESERIRSLIYPAYRLPTEAEWEYASRGLLEQENYPWEGKSLREARGRFRANFKRGRGDYAGRSNAARNTGLVEGLNDGYMISAPVRAFWPNDFGLYNMAGNVAEWTLDTYRILSYEDFDDLNSCRRWGEYKTDYKIEYDPTTKFPTYSELGHADQVTRDVDYRRGDVYNLLFNPNPGPNPSSDQLDRVKIYRGGSWADIAYYLTCGSRRFLNADSSKSTIGFRCAMIKVGNPIE